MADSYSIVEARDRFAEIIHDLTRVGRVEVTRRGRRVAVLLSAEEFDRLSNPRTQFWPAYLKFRKEYDLPNLGIEPEVFANVRDRSSGREVEW